MNHQILGFPNQLQQPLPQPLPTILSEAFILFSQQRHLQDPWKGRTWQNMAEQFNRFKTLESISSQGFNMSRSFLNQHRQRNPFINPLTLKSVFLWNHRTTSINSFTSSLLHGVFVGLGSKPVLEETPKKIRK